MAELTPETMEQYAADIETGALTAKREMVKWARKMMNAWRDDREDLAEARRLIGRLTRLTEAALITEADAARATSGPPRIIDLRGEYLKADAGLRTYIRNVEARVLRLEKALASEKTP